MNMFQTRFFVLAASGTTAVAILCPSAPEPCSTVSLSCIINDPLAATDISGVKNIGATVVEVGNATDKIVVVVKVIGLGIVVVEGFVLTTGTVVVVVVVVPLDG